MRSLAVCLAALASIVGIAGCGPPRTSPAGAAATGRTPGTPPPRFGTAMAYDPVRHRTVLFGGEDGRGSLADTWTWDGRGWGREHPAASPTPREGASMVFEPALGAVVLLGGTAYRPGPGCPDPYAPVVHRSDQGAGSAGPDAAAPSAYVDPCPSPARLRDMWSWNGETWRSLGTEPFAGDLGGVAWDAQQRDLVAVGTALDTWTWDGHRWNGAPSGQVIGSPELFDLTTDAASGRPLLLLFGLGPPCDGGASAPGPSPGNHGRRSPGVSSAGGMINCAVSPDGRSYTGYVASTWRWTGDAWAQVFTSDMPFPPGAMTAGATSPSVLLGRTDTGQPDTWTWTGADWVHAATSVAPPLEALLTPGAIADGPAPGSVVYFAPGDPCSIAAGTSAPGCTVAAPPGNATWIWDGRAWSRA